MSTIVLYASFVARNVYFSEPKKFFRTWSDRLASRHNLWLEATKEEDDGNFTQAITLYLRDAINNWQSGLLARAALSCSCAATCFLRTNHGELAKILYSEAGIIYEEQSKSAIDLSIRESLWALQRSYENYILAGEESKAQEIYFKYASLAARISPFFGKEEAMQLLGFKEVHSRAITSYNNTMQVTGDLIGSVEDFLESRRAESKLRALDSAMVAGKIGGE